MGEDTAAELRQYYPQEPAVTAEETQLAQRSTGALSWATALTVTTDAELAEADATQCAHKKFRKVVEEFFRPKIKRWNDGHKAELASYNEIDGPLKAAEKLAKAKMGAYTLEQKALRRAEQIKRERAALKAAEEQQLREAEALEERGQLDEADLALGQPIEAPVVAPPPPLPKTKTRLTTTWKFEIVIPSIVPRELCVPNDALIRERLRNTNGLPIQGVRAWKQKA